MVEMTDRVDLEFPAGGFCILPDAYDLDSWE